MYGHGPVGQALLEAGLLDELNLWVQPVLLGNGQLFFRNGARTELRLVATKTCTSPLPFSSNFDAKTPHLARVRL
jgi:dihydrofolate reductase